MAGLVLYDGVISGSAIAAAINVSGSNCVTIPYANGMRVLVLRGS